MSLPRLIAIPPHADAPIVLRCTPFWIGASPSNSRPLYVPGIASRHIAVVERADGYWLSPQRAVLPEAMLNGDTIHAPTRLHHGDVLELLPGVRYRFDAARSVAATPRTVLAEPVAVPTPATPAHTKGRRRRRHSPANALTTWAMALVSVLVVAAIITLNPALQPTQMPPAPLLAGDARYYDALMRLSAEHLERGSTFLDLGLRASALREFAQAVGTIDTSRLRTNPWVQPRVAVLETTIAELYRAKHTQVPDSYLHARPVPHAGDGVLLRFPRLTVEEFAQRFARAQERFGARFHRSLAVTGRNGREHLSLYGTDGAIDLRTSDLTREQIDAAVTELRVAGLRVKDFSNDAILREQIAAARRAGFPERAGTGPHIHVDRYIDRHDPWSADPLATAARR